MKFIYESKFWNPCKTHFETFNKDSKLQITIPIKYYKSTVNAYNE